MCVFVGHMRIETLMKLIHILYYILYSVGGHRSEAFLQHRKRSRFLAPKLDHRSHKRMIAQHPAEQTAGCSKTASERPHENITLQRPTQGRRRPQRMTLSIYDSLALKHDAKMNMFIASSGWPFERYVFNRTGIRLPDEGA